MAEKRSSLSTNAHPNGVDEQGSINNNHNNHKVAKLSTIANNNDADHKSLNGKATQFCPAERIKGFMAPTVWHEFTPLANECKAINLGQGFPGWFAPDFLKQAMCNAVNNNFNQYARSAGHMKLVQTLAKKYSKTLTRNVVAETEVVITAGATEALFGVIQGLINPGDEVLMLEPSFDIYQAIVDMAGGVSKTVPLRAVADDQGNKHWKFDINELQQAFSAKTRILLLNSPHNPTGKVFTVDELTQLANLVKQHPNVVVVSDEVYEHMIYDGYKHTSIASLEGMWERSITVSSSGKTFSITGWKVGWAVGPAYLVRPVAVVHQWVSFSVCTPAQEAVAEAMEKAEEPYEGYDSYYQWLCDLYLKKRDFLAKTLRDAGIVPIIPEGGFFIMGDTANIQVPQKYLDDTTVTRDWALCRWLTRDIRVAAIPPSSFHSDKNRHLAANFARFAFCKTDEEMQEAAVRLTKVKDFLK